MKCKIATTDLHYLTHMDNLHKYSLALIACVGDGSSGKHKHLEYHSSFTIGLLFSLALHQHESVLSPNSRLVLRKHELVSHSLKVDTMGRKQRQILPMTNEFALAC